MDDTLRIALEHPDLVELAADIIEDQLELEPDEDVPVELSEEEFEALCMLATIGLETVYKERARITESN